jgi:hypothetical protein
MELNAMVNPELIVDELPTTKLVEKIEGPPQ